MPMLPLERIIAQKSKEDAEVAVRIYESRTKKKYVEPKPAKITRKIEEKRQVVIKEETEKTGSRNMAIIKLQQQGVLPYGYGGVRPLTTGVSETYASEHHGIKPYDPDYGTIYQRYDTSIDTLETAKANINQSIAMGQELLPEQKKSIEAQEATLESFEKDAPTGEGYYWTLPDDPTTPDVDESKVEYSRSEIVKMLSSTIAQNWEIYQKNIEAQEKNIKTIGEIKTDLFTLKSGKETVKTYERKGWYVDVVGEGFEFKEPTFQEISGKIHGKDLSEKRIIAGIVQEWGIPAAVGITLSTGHAIFGSLMEGKDPLKGQIEGMFKGVNAEMNRQYEKSVRLTRRKGEHPLEFTGRFWTSPEAIEHVYLPLVTMGIGQAYTLLKGGATGTITAGKIATFGAKHGMKSVKIVERGLLGAGMVGAGVSGAAIGYTYATAPEMGPAAVGQVAKGWVTAIAGFKLGEHIVKTKAGMPKPYVPQDYLKEGDWVIKRQDVNLMDEYPEGIIEPVGEKGAIYRIMWKPKTPMYGIEEITTGGYAYSEGTQPVDIVVTLGKTKIVGATQQTGLFGLTKTQITSFISPSYGQKFAITNLETTIPWKAYSQGRTSTGSIFTKSVGIVSKKGYEGIVEYDLLGEGFKSLTETVKADLYPQWSSGKYLSVSRGTPKTVTFGRLDSRMVIAVTGESSFFNKATAVGDISTTGTSMPSETGLVSQLKFKLLTGTDNISTIIAKYITGSSMAIASLRGAIPSLVSIEKLVDIQSLSEISQINRMERLSMIELNRVNTVTIPIQKLGEIGTQRTEIAKITRISMDEQNIQKMAQIQRLNEMQRLEQVKIQKLAQLTQLEMITAQITPQIPFPLHLPLFPMSGRGIRGFDWKMRKEVYKFRKAKIGLPFGKMPEMDVKLK